jgi:hypothetical protein
MDIRGVWDCNGNGVNPSIYNPSLFIPTDGTLYRRIGVGMDQGNFDIREEFHTYVMAKEERPYHGGVVPLDICKTDNLDEPLMRWTIPPFDWYSSPYFTLCMLTRALELCFGDRRDHTNPFQWETVQLNMPCTDGYDPSIPRVHLIRRDGEAASGVITFFDYGRVCGVGKPRVHAALRLVCSRLQFYSNQEAVSRR